MRGRIAGAVMPTLFVLAAACLLVHYLWGQQAGTDDGGARQTREAQRVLSTQVPEGPVVKGASIEPVVVPVDRGEALATMRIPRFGRDWEWTALEGTDDATIADGPGHYTGTALPGERGNSAWAAHRAGHGDPFIDFDLLVPGDRVIFEQGQARWVYRITMRPRIIDTTDVWVLDPLRGRRLTLTTCWPKYGSERRMYVRAILVS